MNSQLNIRRIKIWKKYPNWKNKYFNGNRVGGLLDYSGIF